MRLAVYQAIGAAAAMSWVSMQRGTAAERDSRVDGERSGDRGVTPRCETACHRSMSVDTMRGEIMARQAMQAQPLPDVAEWKRLHCSFCGMDADHVRFLTAGISGGMICDVCCLEAF